MSEQRYRTTKSASRKHRLREAEFEFSAETFQVFHADFQVDIGAV
jgi:hypothetical protein